MSESEALIWAVTKKNCSKGVRRTHPVRLFTLEKGSLQSRRVQCDSGLARKKVVDVSVNDDGIPVLSLKNDKEDELRNPDKMWRVITLSGGVRKALAKTDSLLSVYSPAMKKPAMRKVSLYYQALGRMNRTASS